MSALECSYNWPKKGMLVGLLSINYHQLKREKGFLGALGEQ